MEVSTVPDMPTTEELRAFVGPNADYYLSVWEPALTGTGRAYATNKWVFLVPTYWLALRGMSGTAIIFAAILAAMQFVVEVLTSVAPESVGLVALLAMTIVLAFSVVCVVKGNGWYLQYACEEIAHIRTKNLPERDHMAAVTQRGGLRGGQLIFFIVVSSILFATTDAAGGSVARAIARW